MLDLALIWIKNNLGLGSYWLVYYIICFVFICIFISLYIKFRNNISPSLKHILITILLIFLIRFVLFGNTFIWNYYLSKLSHEDIGVRQYHVIRHENKKYLKDLYPNKLDYLAVGSSQTGDMYANFKPTNGISFKEFHMGGFSTLDYMLYRDYIMIYNPSKILLLLSEFDLGRQPDLSAMIYAPFQGTYYLDIIGNFRNYDFITKDDYKLIAKMLIGQVFPEIKYSFIYQGLLNKFTKKKEALNLESYLTVPNTTKIKWQLRRLKNLSSRPLDYHISFLEDFISYCYAKKIDVYIIEGQYTSLAYSKKNLELNTIVKNKMYYLTNKFSNLKFIPRSELYQLKPEDFKDAYHAEKEAGNLLANNIIEYIEEMNSP